MSIRNNEERIGAVDKSSGSDLAPIQAAQQLLNPLNFVTPTLMVDLPSKGEFYPEDHPLHKQEMLEIKHMTAKEEDILTSPAYLKKGNVLDKLIESVLVDKSINSKTILACDRNAIVIQSRISGFGTHYQAKVTCPSCKSEQDEEFDLLECEETSFSKEKEDCKHLGNGLFECTLPQTGVVCHFGLLTGKEEGVLLKEMAQKKQHSVFTTQLKLMIKRLNEYDDQKTIDYFSERMPTKDARYLRKLYAEVAPESKLTFKFECSECDYEGDLGVPLDESFLWPRQ